MTKLAIAAILALTTPLIEAAELRVPTEYSTIQAAIDFASAGDSVLVDPGTYPELIDFLGKDIEVIGVGGPLVTVIDGTGLALGSTRSVVSLVSGEPATARLEGFTVRGGGGTFGRGGGIRIIDSAATIRRNLIVENELEFFLNFGGGIYVDNSVGTRVEGNVILQNTVAQEGGGIFASSSDNLLIEDNVIAFNRAFEVSGSGSASGCGGGLSVAGCQDLMVRNNLFFANVASAPPFGTGGAIFLHTALNNRIVNNTFVGNEAFLVGSAVYALLIVEPAVVESCIVWDNITTGAMDPDLPQLVSSGGPSVVRYSDVQNGDGLGPTNFDLDPLFVPGPSFADSRLTGLEAFYLSQTAGGQSQDSPCVDAGDPSAAYLPVGATRTDGVADTGIVDVGFHYTESLYFQVPFLRGDASLDGAVDIADAIQILESLFAPSGPVVQCRDGADANDDGAIDISDAIRLLSFLFGLGPPLPSPGSDDCGFDPTDDDLSCVVSSCAP